MIYKSTSKATTVKLLKAYNIKISYKACNAPQILKTLWVWQYMSPATGEVVVISIRGNPKMYVITEKPEFTCARFLVSMELGYSI